MIEGVKKFEMPINGVRLPKFKTDNDKYGKSDGSKEQNFELIKNICLKRLKEIGKDKDAKYIDQLKYELDILNELDFVDYILLVWDIINYCKKNDIPVGPGRGCLHKETKILTYKNRFKPCENKYKPISKIRVGDTVYDKDYKKSRVEKVFKYRVRETLYSFITYGRKCQTAVTGDHKILAQKKGESQFDWHKAEDIKIGDTIAACSQPKQNYVFLPFSFNCDPDYVREKIYLRNTDKINLDEIAERSGFPVDKISSYQRGNRHIAKKDAQRINETLFAMKIGLEDFYAIRTNKEIVKRRKFFLTNGARFMYRRYVINGALNKLNVTLYFDNYETAQLNKVKKYLREFFGSYYDLMVDEKSTGQRIRLIIKSDIIRNILIECDAVEKRSYFGEPVKEIKSILANGFVYDLMVENDPSYHTYDQIVHNSAAGSLVLYLTQITQVDPIRYNLYFERFVSKVRAKKQVIDGITYLDGSLMVDIDFDICYYKRPDLLKYIENKYHGKSCKILNLNTLTAKILIKDIGKIVGQYSETQMNEVSSMIPSEFGKVKDLDWCYENVEDFKNWVETDERSKKVYNTALNLKDLIKNKAVHASGIIIAHDDLDNCCPIELTSDKDYVSAFSKDDAASILVKIDALGLKTLSIIDETCKAIGIKPQDIDPEDPFIYQQLQDLKHPKGLFQIEADCAFGVCRKVKPKSLEGLSAVMSLARPGALEFVDQYAKFSEHGLDGPAGSGSNKLDEIMGVTGNTILFQEQLMKIASEVFELSLDDAELIRRCVTGDTKFLSKTRGWIEINDLLKNGYKNDLFLIMDSNGNQSWEPIKDIWSNGKKQVRYVETKDGLEVKSTMNHQFLTDSGWKARQRISNEDYLLGTFKCDDFYGKKTISDDLAIILAGIMTEGYFVHGSQITFTNYDKSIYDTFYNACVNLFGVENVKKRPCGKVISLNKLCGETLCRYINRGKSANKDIPKIIFSQDKATIKKFISFAFACEATITEEELSFTSKSRNLIKNLQLVLTYFNIRSFVNIKVNKKYGDFFILNISPSSQGKYLKRSKDVIEEYLQEYKLIKLNKYLENKSKSLFDGGGCFDEVPRSIVSKFMDQYPQIPHELKIASGRFYKNGNNVSKETFNKICHHSQDKYWINKSNGYQNYCKVDKIEKEIREVEVFDFSMDEKKPYIVANGLVIHNCVGKKKIKEMEKFKAIIEKQGNKLNIPDAAQFYWDTLEASANYSFNSSHSISYATLSAQTIYLKFKYPKEFFCALLRMANNEQDSTEEIALIEKEMEAFGVKILPPSIISSKDDFTIEGDCIRYGLLPIKGVSKVSLRKIDDFRESFLTQKGEVTKRLPNKFAFFESAKNYKIPMNVICPLIQAGAIDGHYNQSRSKLVLECQIWNKMTEREKKFAMDIGKKHDYDLILVINELKTMTDEKDKPVFKISKSYNRLNTLRDACSPYQSIYKQNSKNEEFANWYYETKLIGYSISYRLKNALNLKGVDLIGLEEKDDYVEDKMITCGVVKKVEEATSKNGNPYVKIHLTDEKSFCKVMVFSRNRDKAFAANAEGAPPKKDNIVCVSGQVKDGGTIWSDLVTVQDKKIYMKLSELA